MTEAAEGRHWVFGYGSLIWRPGFAFLENRAALLRGAHRELCIYSHHHRGSPETPGLVFGLVRGGSCRGVAFAVDDASWTEVREYLKRREQVSAVYRDVVRPVRLLGGQTVRALTFVVDETHVQYAGRLPLAEQVGLVRTGFGESGANVEYVLNTADHLSALGIVDRKVAELAMMLRALAPGAA